uniref:Uncharacterized protein n=1 Tax=mine drainage metagenome TaxID=410659 RepID=E6PCM0_9ZZZZ
MQSYMGTTQLAGLIGSTLTTILGFSGGAIDFNQPIPSTDSALQVTLTQIDQILGALENAVHGGNITQDILQIAQALYARNVSVEDQLNSAQKIYSDFQQIGKGPQQTIDGILSMGRDILDFGQANGSGLTGANALLYKDKVLLSKDLGNAENLVDSGFAALGALGALSQGGSAAAVAADAARLGLDLHLHGAVGKDCYDVLSGISDLSQISRGGFMNVAEGSINLGETFVSSSSEFGQWLHNHGQDVLGAASAFEEILGGGVLNIAQGTVNLGEDLVKLNVVSAKSALGSWLTSNGLRFTGIVGGISSIVSGFEEGGVAGGAQAGIGADVLLTSIGATGGLATPIAIVIGILTIAFGGHHDNPATMPDKYDTQRYGQMDAAITGSSNPSGQSFTEDPTLRKLFGGRTGIQAIEETLAFYKTKANAPGWLQPLWHQLSAMFGETAQGTGHLSIGINGTGKDCNNQEVTGATGTDGKVYQYTQLGGMVYAFAAALAEGTRGEGLAPAVSYSGPYPTIAGLDWHAAQTPSGYGFYAEDTSNFGSFYSYDPANNNLYYSTTLGTIGGTWVGDVRTYDFKNHSAIVGEAPPTPTYGHVLWHGFTLPQGGIGYWGAVTTKKIVGDPGLSGLNDPGLLGVKGPRGPHIIVEEQTTYYFFGPNGNLYVGSGPGTLAEGTLIGDASNYDFKKGGNQISSPAPIKPPKPISTPPPAANGEGSVSTASPSPSKKPIVHTPPYNPVTPPTIPKSIVTRLLSSANASTTPSKVLTGHARLSTISTTGVNAEKPRVSVVA